MKRVFGTLAVSIAMYLALAGATVADEEKVGPFVIHEIALDPQHPQILYAATSNYGILKSTDGGATWGLTNRGLRSYTHHAVVVNPVAPNILYVGAWGGGVSKSVDGGAHWMEVNDGLGNTAIEDLVLDPIHPETLYVATTTGVFKSPDGGESWIPFSKGLPVSRIEIFERLFIPPSGSIELLLGTSRGLFKRERSAPSWEAVKGVVAEQHITAMAAYPKGHLLYAGTIKDGVLQSLDRGKTWAALRGKIEKTWVSDITLHPHRPEILYVSTRGSGILKSQDGGTTWQEVNTGLPVTDIRSLAIDPKNPKMLYAGTTHDGLVKTSDGGNHWSQLTGYPLLTHTEIVDSVSGTDRLQGQSSSPSVPPEFLKCNQCHGWADPLLNFKKTYWRVPPNQRDWEPTINRMSLRAHLTQEESSKILEFLSTYTSVSSSFQASAQEMVRRVCSRCHALQVMGKCVAGDCEGSRVVRVIKSPPWDLVVDWMKSMGADMTETEKQTIQAYLQESFPAKPYPLQWTKVPAHLGEGGWNVVTLKEHAGHLYAGLEGNGRIFRSRDGTRWQEVANTDHYTVYGITPFQGALYAGTNDPDPRIWKSTDGVNWTPEATLPPEDRGVISLGVFKQYLYAGTGRAWIYRSPDGRQWEKVADLEHISTADYTHWVRFLVQFQEHLYAGIERGPLYRSSDGVTWSPVGQKVTASTGVRGAAVFKEALYIGTTGGGEIWSSQDGLTWQKVFKAPTHIMRGYVASMAVAGDNLFIGIDGYVFRTTDGQTWEEVGHLSPTTIEALAPFKNDLYIGTLLSPQAQLYRASLAP